MKDTNNKQRKIISVFFEEYRKKILTEFDFEAVVNGAMVGTIDGREIKIDEIDKERGEIHGFIYDENNHKWGETMHWWNKNGYLFGNEELDSFDAMQNLAILNYASLVKNKVKKDKNKCRKVIIPFNLDAVLNGELVETIDGREIEIEQIINYPSFDDYSIFAYIIDNNRKKVGNSYWWYNDGRKYKNETSNLDLVIVRYLEDNSKTDNSEIKNIEINHGGTKINIGNNDDYVQVKIIKPFNLDAVRRGAQIETKDGNRVILDRIEDKPDKFGRILCGWEQSCIGSHVNWWRSDGRLFEDEDTDSDLVIVEYVQIREDKPTVKSIDIDGLRINLS